jgi:hypothetical protein
MANDRFFEIVVEEKRKLYFMDKEPEKGIQNKAIDNIISGGIHTSIEHVEIKGRQVDVCIIFPESLDTKSYLNSLVGELGFFLSREADSVCLDIKYNVLWTLDENTQNIVASILKSIRN